MRISDAFQVMGWKYGGAESSSTLNSINMLGYTGDATNVSLANDIWKWNQKS